MLVLLDQPNVLILDEPDNDLDIDMLAVVESLLDTWPGTLLLITHDRYLMERVTDDQFALVDGRILHMPGGVDEYLELLDRRDSVRAQATAATPTNRASASASETSDSAAEAPPALTRAEEYALKKELASTERILETLAAKVEAVRAEADAVDPSDYVALLDAQARLRDAERAVADVEDRWIDISERLHPHG